MDTTTYQNTTNILNYVIFGIILVTCLVCYIIALIRTRKKQMVTFVNWWEFGGSTLGCVLTLVGIALLLSAEWLWGIILLLLGLAAVIFCARFCLKANDGNIKDTIIATLAKFFVIVISYLAFMSILEKPSEGDTYKSYRIKNGIAVAVAAFLLFSLVGSGKHEKLVETLKV